MNSFSMSSIATKMFYRESNLGPPEMLLNFRVIEVLSMLLLSYLALIWLFLRSNHNFERFYALCINYLFLCTYNLIYYKLNTSKHWNRLASDWVFILPQFEWTLICTQCLSQYCLDFNCRNRIKLNILYIKKNIN